MATGELLAGVASVVMPAEIPPVIVVAPAGADSAFILLTSARSVHELLSAQGD